METGTAKAGGEAKPPLLERMVNRMLRCSHRHLGLPITLRGESFAVCLDCGQRVAHDFHALRAVPSVKGGPIPQTRGRGGDFRAWSHNIVWIGLYVLGLSGGLYYSSLERKPSPTVLPGPRKPGRVHVAQIAKAQPPSVEAPETPEAPPVIWSVVPLPAVQAAPHAPAPAPAATPSSAVLRPSPAKSIVLARDQASALDVLRHPANLGRLVQSGSLFTVPGGTAMEVRQKERDIVRVVILKGTMAGQEGWVAASRLAP